MFVYCVFAGEDVCVSMMNSISVQKGTHAAFAWNSVWQRASAGIAKQAEDWKARVSQTQQQLQRGSAAVAKQTEDWKSKVTLQNTTTLFMQSLGLGQANTYASSKIVRNTVCVWLCVCIEV
jgi:hypothetical protein